MRVSKLFYLLKKHNIPHNVRILSDSGWECYETDVDGVYYSKKHNAIILTQDNEEDVKHIEEYIRHKADKFFNSGDIFEDLVYLK